MIGNNLAGISVLVVSVSCPDGQITKIEATAESLNKSIGVVVPIETLSSWKMDRRQMIAS